jgi:hypothetical protein
MMLVLRKRPPAQYAVYQQQTNMLRQHLVVMLIMLLMNILKTVLCGFKCFFKCGSPLKMMH